ncbi:MAG: EAL domain-containing protein [Sideroxydans sp.]|nr:EAL domain-containing protein [Sideroxydans sp.]
MLTIRAQLLALVVAFAIPALALMAYVALENVQHETENEQAYARTLTVITASDISRVLQTNIDLLQQMAKRPGIRLVDEHRCDPILWDFRQLFPKSANMTVIDLAGTAICSAVPQPGGNKVSIVNSPWFPRTRTAESEVVSDPFYGPITGRWVTVLTYPIRTGQGRKLGYLGLPLDLALYEPNLSQAPLEPGTVVGVITESGVVVWRNIDAEKWVGKRLINNEQVRSLLALRDGEMSATGVDGVRRFYSIKPIKGVNWYAYVGIPVEGGYAKLGDTFWQNGVVGGGIFVSILLLAWWIARRISRPVLGLASLARSVRQGDHQARAQLAGPPELREVAREFNDMLEVRSRIEAALRTSEAKLNEALHIARIGYWEYEVASGEFIFNDHYYALYGGTTEQFGGYRQKAAAFMQRWVHPEDVSRVGERVEEGLRPAGESIKFHDESRIFGMDGSIRWLEVTFRRELNEQGQVVRLIGAAQDITERKHAEASQRKLNRALKLLSDCNTTLVHAVDENALLADICQLIVQRGGYCMAWVGYAKPDGITGMRPIAYASEAGHAAAATQQMPIELIAEHDLSVQACLTRQTVIDPDIAKHHGDTRWKTAMLEHGFSSGIALPLLVERACLGSLSIYARDTEAFEEEEVRLLEEMAEDLAFGIETLRTRQKHAEAELRLEFLAHHDALTGLPNRILLRDRFEQAVAQSERTNTGVAVMFLDLDNFKEVNDTLGHSLGDKLLVEVVGRLREALRDSDTISRQGGDEFIILLPEVEGTDVMSNIAQHINDVFNEPFEVGEYSINTSVSLGISHYPRDDRDFDALLRNADTAMFQAKESGRNTYRFYSEKMNLDAQEQMFLHGRMRTALKDNEFKLHYQPQIDLDDGRIVGVEALLRWSHPEMGTIPPSRFIPLAERSGLIIPIGEWVLHEACRQGRVWHDQGKALMVAVNLSALQFKRGNLVETVSQALQQSGLPAESLELELTESILLQDVELAIKTLHALKELGVRLSIDDFGTGYSSLSYLKRLAVDKLKIDQSFVRDLNRSADSDAIVRAIIQLGHALQLELIAEGVETAEQLTFLRAHGCDMVQGYYFSKPVEAGHVFDGERQGAG